ncbi:MAG: 16S rRNA (guanine(966)-N(2))-methyltransferase RsmD [Rhodospirillaceae bacterium]|nr:MAG: 16S rRNA (guanine(966)-N(2))-methyltransferase RsmD [Rhodospirillaceae bacterium]
MRIVSGKHKGRPLAAPKGHDTRPTSDRAREAIFNVLEHGIPGPGLRDSRVIDVFAGTGALGLEALSRGAAHCTFVENSAGARRSLDENIQALDEVQACTVLKIKAQAMGETAKPCDYAFLDAPYNQDLSTPALQALADGGWLKDEGVVVVEVAKTEALPLPDGFILHKEKDYGAARAVFLIYSA